MNWKKKLTEIKVGDVVRLVAENTDCGTCCARMMKKNLKLGTFCKVKNINDRGWGYQLHNLPGTGHKFSCNVPESCIEKVYDHELEK